MLGWRLYIHEWIRKDLYVHLYHCNSPEPIVDWAVDLTAVDCVGGPPEGMEAVKVEMYTDKDMQN